MFIFFLVYLVKIYKVWLWLILECRIIYDGGSTNVPPLPGRTHQKFRVQANNKWIWKETRRNWYDTKTGAYLFGIVAGTLSGEFNIVCIGAHKKTECEPRAYKFIGGERLELESKIGSSKNLNLNLLIFFWKNYHSVDNVIFYKCVIFRTQYVVFWA
jgi:hypothetical protein